MFAALADYGRLLKAGVSLARHDVVLPNEYKSRLPAPALGVGKLLRMLTGGARGRPGERLAKALESLGPAYIKLGQFIATRPDVFGVETTQDLSRLKDDLPPFAMDKARETLRTEFQPEKAEALFPKLGEPVAAASLAQVHKLQTEEGAWAVKILRPGVEKQIRLELRAMKRAAADVERTSEDSRRMEPVAFVDTVAAAMEKELDLTLEAGATDEMREKTLDDGHFLVPSVDWERSSRRVLTTSWVDGTPMTDPNALHGINNKPELANAVTRGFLTHAIYHGVFHADMHEGNMILTPDNRIALVDFGIVGRIGPNERRFLAEILYGFLRRDYRRIAEVHFEAGYVPADRSVDDFAQALRSVGEPIHGKAAEDVSMGKLLLHLFDITHTFGMHLRPELVLLQKTMVQVEGVARSIDPTHNIWKAAEPVVEKWIRNQLGPAGAAKLVRENVREVSDRLKRLPQMMDAMEQAVAKVNAMPTEPVKRERFAPWWGWFALIGVLAVLATGIVLEN
ncbi:MAG: AarF/UbiB family protein [Pseudomonadota bacterium]